jgi:protein-S-isoprenylcysteine O-methyltransferase Ste14
MLLMSSDANHISDVSPYPSKQANETGARSSERYGNRSTCGEITTCTVACVCGSSRCCTPERRVYIGKHLLESLPRATGRTPHISSRVHLYHVVMVKTAPALSFGKPIDPSADVPIFPPFAMFMTMMTGRLIWYLSGKQLSFLPKFLRPLSVRVAILAVGLAFTKFVVLDGAGGDLKKAGSGTLFTTVDGLATEGLFAITRNPMYSALVFMAIPSLSMVVNSAWPILLSPLTWCYLNFVVIAAEEKQLAAVFGREYESYCNQVPRWLL